mmetsp:Transcript_40912/g.112479  ORF Transcript_40912/g.112479 Transcript_40912/m.112479 type:complete len:215 (-) Transcript_40912:389-1033(-)
MLRGLPPGRPALLLHRTSICRPADVPQQLSQRRCDEHQGPRRAFLQLLGLQQGSRKSLRTRGCMVNARVHHRRRIRAKVEVAAGHMGPCAFARDGAIQDDASQSLLVRFFAEVVVAIVRAPTMQLMHEELIFLGRFRIACLPGLVQQQAMAGLLLPARGRDVHNKQLKTTAALGAKLLKELEHVSLRTGAAALQVEKKEQHHAARNGSCTSGSS